MNKHVKRLWVAALRSGKYKENLDGYWLRHGDTYDPLGVLCDLHRKQVKKKGWVYCKHDNCYRYREHTTTLPICVVEWAGLPRQNLLIQTVHVTYRGVETTIASLVDKEKLPFKKIANLIEKQL